MQNNYKPQHNSKKKLIRGRNSDRVQGDLMRSENLNIFKQRNSNITLTGQFEHHVVNESNAIENSRSTERNLPVADDNSEMPKIRE